MKKIKDLTALEIKAMISLYSKCQYQKKSLMEIFDISKYMVDVIIDNNLIKNRLYYQKAVDEIYPKFERCLAVLNTSVKEMRYPYGNKYSTAKKAAIAMYLYSGSGSREKEIICGLLGRERVSFAYYESIQHQPHVKLLIDKLEL